MMKPELYPLRFRPQFVEKVWGGGKLKQVLQKNTAAYGIGESWEISAVAPRVSTVSNGALKGQLLTSLLDEYGADLVGAEVYERLKGEFPLLFKYIDAKENLSLQVHPNDQLAYKRHRSFGKAEMWYILQADRDAGIYAGFIPGTTREDYLKALDNDCLQELMNFVKVSPGEVYSIKPGLVHAIGRGVLLAEIQQSSDITYRVFDWNRTNAEGESRQLHTELAKGAINFKENDFRVVYKVDENQWMELVKNRYFKTRKIHLNGFVKEDYTKLDSLVIYMCVGGKALIEAADRKETLKTGETLLLPAGIHQVSLKANQADLLEISA